MLKNKKCWRTYCLMTSLISLKQWNVKKLEKLMRVVNMDGENLHIIWTTWGISIKFSAKMWLMAILKVTKNQGYNISPENDILEKSHRGRGNSPLSRFRVNAWNDEITRKH